MNSENRKKFAVLGALGIALVIVLVLQFSGGSGNPAPVQTAMTQNGVSVGVGEEGVVLSTSVFQETDVNIDSLIQRVREVEFDYDVDHLARNPTLPILGGSKYLAQRAAQLATGTTDDLLYAANSKELTGILWSENNPMAVIDNEVVHVGYRFLEPIEVITIEPTRIVLAIDGQDVEVVKELKEQ